MKSVVGSILALLLGFGVAPAVSNDAPVTAPATASPPAPAAAPAEAAPVVEVKPLKIPAGYRKRLIKGQEMYCTITTTVGTRFPREVCMTEAGLRNLIEQRAAQQEDLNRTQSLCASASRCGVQ